MTAPLRVGEVVTATRTLTQDDSDRFAALTGDDNPIHVDPAYASRTRFATTVAHGMHLYALIRSVVLGRWADVVEVSQELMFPAPARAGADLHIRAEIAAVTGEEARIATTVVDDAGIEVCVAETVVMPAEDAR